MIVKIQRPLASNHGETRVLVYNANRSLQMYCPMTPYLDELFGSAFKIYAKAKIKGSKAKPTLELIEVVEDQPW